MSVDDSLTLFRAYMQDSDPVNPALPSVDDPSAYLDPIEQPGEFVEKLLSGKASAVTEKDDLEKEAPERPFANPLNLEKNTMGYKLRIVRRTVTETAGVRFAEGFDDSGKLVWSHPILEEK